MEITLDIHELDSIRWRRQRRRVVTFSLMHLSNLFGEGDNSIETFGMVGVPPITQPRCHILAWIHCRARRLRNDSHQFFSIMSSSDRLVVAARISSSSKRTPFPMATIRKAKQLCIYQILLRNI